MTHTPSNPRRSAATTVASLAALAALGVAPHPAHAQSSPREELYAGGPVPQGAHVVRRPNGYVITAGAVLFGAGYVPWAIQAIGDATQSPQTNSERGSVFRVVPFAGPFIANVVYDQHQRDDCAAFVAMNPNGEVPMAGTIPPSSPACINTTANMYDASGHPLPRNNEPSLSTGGDWVWAFTQAGAQIIGVGLVIWGILGNEYVVYDDPAQAALARRDHVGAWRFSLVPGAPGAALGLSLAGVQF